MGVFVILWGVFIDKSKNTLFWGGILIVLSIAGFTDNFYKKGQEDKKKEKQRKQEQEEQEKEKRAVISLYDSLSYKESYIIDKCINENTNIYDDGSFRIDLNKDANALVLKGFGYIQSNLLSIKPKYIRWIKEYKNEQEQLKKDKRKNNKKKQGAKNAN